MNQPAPITHEQYVAQEDAYRAEVAAREARVREALRAENAPNVASYPAGFLRRMRSTPEEKAAAQAAFEADQHAARLREAREGSVRQAPPETEPSPELAVLARIADRLDALGDVRGDLDRLTARLEALPPSPAPATMPLPAPLPPLPGGVAPSPTIPDEMHAGVPAPARPQPTGDRQAGGRLAPGKGTSELAALGGRARAEAIRLDRLMGRVELPEGHPMLAYRRDAADWRDAHLARLASTVGGGEVGPAVAAIVSSAALQHAASRALFDAAAQEQDGAKALQASRLADAARQNILAAHEICAREAKARAEQDDGAFWTKPEPPTTVPDEDEIDRQSPCGSWMRCGGPSISVAPVAE